MKIKLNREDFLSKLSLATRFTSSKLSSLSIIQGIYLQFEEDKLHLHSSNLNAYFHTVVPAEVEKKAIAIIEPRKLIEFLTFLIDGKIDLELKENQLIVKSEKTKGAFPLMNMGDFPLPPTIEEKKQKIKTNLLLKNLPLVLFSASADETRPALSGINFVTNDELTLVATDGFRLSLVKIKGEGRLPSLIIPADFLKELNHFIKDEKEVDFSYSEKEKIVLFKAGETEFYSRLIEGDFPPFEKVIPSERKTVVSLDKEELLRNIKLISVFARDLSHILILEAKKDGVHLMPKSTAGEEDSAFQEGQIEGEEQKVAFNYKFLVDFLNVADSKNVVIEILRSDAPVVFKIDNNPNFLHIIMPVRIQE